MKNLKTYSSNETSLKTYIEFITEEASSEIKRVNDLGDKNLNTNGIEVPPKPFISSGDDENEEEQTFHINDNSLKSL